MRTIDADIQAAMESGNYTFTAEVLILNKDNLTEILASTPAISFEIKNLTAKATIETTEDNVGYLSMGEFPSGSRFAIRRTINAQGKTYSVTTPPYYTYTSADKRYIYLDGLLLPPFHRTITPNRTYYQVLEAITGYYGEDILDLRFQDASNPIWNTQFMPEGRTIVLNPSSSIETLFRQKYLIGMRAGDFNQHGTIELYLFHPTVAQNGAPTYRYPQYLQPSRPIKKKLIWRDEGNTLHETLPPEWDYYGFTIHNLGFIPSTTPGPTYLDGYSDEKTIIPANLKIQTGDFIGISIDKGLPYTARAYSINVLEKFDQKLTPPWQMELSAYQHFSNTEGGALPSTIEAAAPYTPLNTSGFSRFLTDAVNNLQALANWVNDFVIHWLSAWSSSTAYTINDIVYSGGSSYICIQAHTNQPPPNPAYWNIFAAQGATGATGPTGPAGPAPSGTGLVKVVNGALQTPDNAIDGATLKGTTVLGAGDGTAAPIAAIVRGAAGTGNDVAGQNITHQAQGGTGNGPSGSIIYQTAPARADGIGIGNITTVHATAASTPATAHTIANNARRILRINVQTRNYNPATSVTYGGQALTRLIRRAFSASQNVPVSDIWELADPPVGTANWVVNCAGAEIISAEAIDFYNVDPTAPADCTSAAGTSSTPTIDIASQTGDLITDSLAAWDTGAPTVGANQSTIGNLNEQSWRGASSYEAGAGTVTMSWSLSASRDWVIAVAKVKLAGRATPNPMVDTFLITPSGIQAKHALTTPAPRAVTTSAAAVALTDMSIIANYAGTVTLTFPAAASYPGRWLTIKTITANAVISASSNIVPLTGGTPATALLPATPGKWADLQSDGANWIIVRAN